MSEGGRVRSLDGLRGLAAVIVAFGHATIATSPVLALIALGHPVHLSSFQEAISYTPLHALWAGREWVIVFFVLSGFVLSVGAIAAFDARSYYPRRIIRLYVPVWAAVLFAVCAHLAVSHDSIPGATMWLNSHDQPLSLGSLAHQLTLVFGAGDGSVTTVLWSLRWEVLFSLALPLYLLLARSVKPLLLAGISLLIIFLGNDGYTHYMPVFMLGVIVARERARIEEHLTDAGALLLLVASFCLLSADWWLQPESLGTTLVAVGATGMVVCGMCSGHFGRLLRSKPFQMVGSRSFSLYLVHEPIVVAVAFAMGGKPSLPLLLLVAAPLIAVVTEGFYRLVERPSHRLARMIVAGGSSPAVVSTGEDEPRLKVAATEPA